MLWETADRRPPASTPATRVWQHPDLLPGSDDLDEPAGFIDRVIGGDTSGFDRAIEEARDRATSTRAATTTPTTPED